MSETPFLFVDDVERFAEPGAHVARLRVGIVGKAELLRVLHEVLEFPDYFGFNWDALADCLRDFEGIEAHTVVLVHSELPRLSPSELHIYLDVLAEGIAIWQPHEDHEFRVVFPTACRDEVAASLSPLD
ncbi:barstar family protein [Nannocystaceae bacterium ST9]